MSKSKIWIVVVSTFLVTAIVVSGLTIILCSKILGPRMAPVEVVANDTYAELDNVRAMFANNGLVELPDEETLIAGAINGMLAVSGDVYSRYFTASDFEAFKQEEEGLYEGVGITIMVNTENTAVQVIRIAPDSPAEKAGVMPGDYIIAVEGEDVDPTDTDTLVSKVRGKVGTEVTVTFYRPSTRKYMDLTMTRQTVTTVRVTSRMLNDTVGYMEITEFQGDVDTEFHRQILDLVDQGCKALVLDLRNNPGGDKNIVCNVADMLFPEGPIIITEDKNGVTDVVNSDADCLDLTVVALGNENTASASELLIGGIQDYKVGILMGTSTYGKGVVQGFYYMTDGAVLKLTVEDYLTGGGRSIQTVGCTPDIEIEPSEELLLNPVLMGSDRDNQLKAALDYLAEKGFR